MTEHPACHVCHAADASVMPVRLSVIAERQGLKSTDSRAQGFDVSVCGACWGKASLATVAASVRAQATTGGKS